VFKRNSLSARAVKANQLIGYLKTQKREG